MSSAYATHLAAVLDRAPITRDEIRQAAAWYPTARRVARTVADRLDVDLPTGAAIVAAYSIRNPWPTNVRDARLYADGITPPGLRQRTVIADACLTHGPDALRGRKTRAFCAAIAGDRTAVPVDVWMARAAGLATLAPTARQHDEIAETVRAMAEARGLAPSTLQALIWARVRTVKPGRQPGGRSAMVSRIEPSACLPTESTAPR